MQNAHGRMDGASSTPQQAFGRGMPPRPGFPPNQGVNPAMANQGMPGGFGGSQGGMNLSNDASNRQYQMHMQQAQQQLQRNNMSMPPRPQPYSMDSSNPNYQPGMNGQQRNQTLPGQMPPNMMAMRKEQTDSLYASLKNFTIKQGRQFNPDPKVSGKSINYYHLLMQVKQYLPEQDPDRWSAVAQGLSLPEQQYPGATQQVRDVFEQNLQDYYEVWQQAMAKRKQFALQQQQAGMVAAANQGSPTQGPPFGSGPPPTAPQVSSGFPPRSQPPSSASQSPPLQGEMNMPQVGIGLDGAGPPSVSAPESLAALNRQTSGPSPSQISSPILIAKETTRSPEVKATPKRRAVSSTQQDSVDRPQLKTHFESMQDNFLSHGGIQLAAGDEEKQNDQSRIKAGLVDVIPTLGAEVASMKSFYPILDDLGHIDIHKLLMCLQSGFHREMKYALDRIVAMSIRPLALPECAEMIDVLVELGESQLDLVVEQSGKSSEAVEIPSCEQLFDTSLNELKSITDEPAWGDTGYELERALDRIGAITLTLSNLSFTDRLPPPQAEANRKVMASPNVMSFIVAIVKLFGNRRGIFGSAKSLQDLMKDVVTFLSNIAESIEFGCEDDALTILQFLLAFGPSPTSSEAPDSKSKMRFYHYEPARYAYLPCAIDSLAKILTRDEPNRAFYRAIFQADEKSNAASSPHTSLLTRTFALAISPMPSHSPLDPSALRVSEARKPFFSQGMLAADILASMSSTSGVNAKMWLESDDEWAPHLLSLVLNMASMDGKQHTQPERGPNGQPVDQAMRGFQMITNRALSMLRRLMEKAGVELRDHEEQHDDLNGMPSVNGIKLRLAEVLPSRRKVFSALSDPGWDAEVLKQLLALSRLDT